MLVVPHSYRQRGPRSIWRGPLVCQTIKNSNSACIHTGLRKSIDTGVLGHAVCLSSIIEHLLVGLLAKAGSSKPKRRRQTDLASNGAAHRVQMSHNSEDTRRSTHATHRAATTVQRDSYSRTLCVHTPKGTTVSHYLFVGSRFACLP